jgi:hypothetical protein
MARDYKDVAFQKQFNFNKKYRSVRLSGFKDNDDNVPMRYKPEITGVVSSLITAARQNEQGSEPSKPDPLTTMVVSDYLTTIKAGNGTPLF